MKLDKEIDFYIYFDVRSNLKDIDCTHDKIFRGTLIQLHQVVWFIKSLKALITSFNSIC